MPVAQRGKFSCSGRTDDAQPASIERTVVGKPAPLNSNVVPMFIGLLGYARVAISKLLFRSVHTEFHNHRLIDSEHP